MSESGGAALDRDHELGEVAVADDAPELLLGDEHAGGGLALAHVAVLPALEAPLGVADNLKYINAQGLVEHRLLASCPVYPSRISVSVSLDTLPA